MKFKLSKKLLEKFPDAVEYIVVARGLNNEIPGKWTTERIEKAGSSIRDKGSEILKEARYSKWTEAYARIAQSAGLDTKDFLPSHIALAKRVLSDKSIPNISPVVNLYNSYSIAHGIPIGGEDLSKVYGDLVLDVTAGGELFLPIGGQAVQVLGEGEIVWRDDHSITCRLWNWRQGERTKITKSTSDAYFIFDSFRGLEGVDLESIVSAFCTELNEKFGAVVESGMIDRGDPEYIVDYLSGNIGDTDVHNDLEGYIATDKPRTKKKSELMRRRPTSLELADPGTLTARLSAMVDESLEDAAPHSSEISISAGSQFGDVSSTLPMRLAKEKRKSPREIAQGYVSKLTVSDRIEGVVSELNVDGKGFINARLSEGFLVSEMERAVSEGEGYGNSNVGENRVILVESPSINPNAAAHAGHLLNLFIGRSLMRLFRKVGFDTYADNLINDRGIKICMAMWGIENLSEAATPQEAGMKPDQFVGTYYVEAKKRYASDPAVKKEIDQMLRDWESGDPKVRALWKKVVSYAYEGHLKTFSRLGEEPGHMWYESDMYKKGRDIINEHLGKGVIEKLPDGAVIGRLEEKYGIPDVVLLRSDGTSLYHTQDIYLTIQKIEKFDPWHAVWVVANEQITHFQQLFALLDELGILSYERLYHFAYGLVVDKNGTKLGKNAADATADALIDQMKSLAKEVIAQRHIDVEVEDEEQVAETVGIGALRYSFLSRDPFRNVVYDPETAVSFTGKSGPYIMYTYARAKSVLRKALKEDVAGYGVDSALDIESSNIEISEIEREVLLRLLMYPEIILSAANKYAPNMIAEYLYDTASAFNNFYEKLTIAGAQGDQKKFRLALTKLLTTVLADGMTILGIDVLEKM
jgi:arginyl-tRNA synthetase